MKAEKWIAACIAVAALIFPVRADLYLALVFSDNAVLQRERSVPVWGWTASGKTVNVSFNGNTAYATADADGFFTAWLPAMPADSTGRNLTISASGETSVTLTNVVVGEVWMCTGQSNMARDMKTDEAYGYTNRTAQIAAANYPGIRFFQPPFYTSDEPLTEFDRRACYGTVWRVITTNSVRDSFSLAYFYGKELHETLGVPVGLLQVAVSGTDVRSWAPSETLQKYYKWLSLDAFDAMYWSTRDSEGLGSNDWPQLMADWRTAWDTAFANHTTLPEWPGRQASSFAVMHKGSSQLYNARVLPLAGYAMRGNIWMQGEGNPGQGGGIYLNIYYGMIKRWRELWGYDFYAICSALSNVGTKQDIPSTAAGADGWCRLNEDFMRASELLTNHATSTAVDLGNTVENVGAVAYAANGVHFERKPDAAHRMAVQALYMAYGQTNVVRSGPTYRSMAVETNKIRLYFDNIGSGLEIRDSGTNGFAIAGTNNVYYWADIQMDGNTLLVSSPSVSAPAKVHYAWHNSNPYVSLYNVEGLPAPLFRTDRINTNLTYTMIASTNALNLNEGTVAGFTLKMNEAPDCYVVDTIERISGSTNIMVAARSNAPLEFARAAAKTPQTVNIYVSGALNSNAATAVFRCQSLDAANTLDITVTANDADTDGLANYWEQQYFGSSTGGVSAADGDGDGQSNWKEYIAGTSPTDGHSRFRLNSLIPQVSGSGHVITWSPVAGRTYSVLWTTNLLNSFQPLESGIAYPRGSWTDTVHGASAEGFYRIEVSLP